MPGHLGTPKTRCQQIKKNSQRFPGAEISLVQIFPGAKMTTSHWLMKFTQMGKWAFYWLLNIAFGTVTVQLAR